MDIDGHVKRCQDYAAVGIGMHSYTRGGQFVNAVTHEWRVVHETTSDYEAAMFAAELYARLVRLPKKKTKRKS